MNSTPAPVARRWVKTVVIRAGALTVALVGVMLDGLSAWGRDVTIQVGPQVQLRGPVADEADSPFNLVRLASGTWRGFTANQITWLLEGGSPIDMAGARRRVMGPRDFGPASECGAWLNSIFRSGATLYGLIHVERQCNYRGNVYAHKAAALARSRDEGVTWEDLGIVIEGAEAPAAGKLTGEGDCTASDGGDGYVYAYCLRARDWQTIVARAPIGTPHEWLKWDGKNWTSPGRGGGAAPLGMAAVGSAYWASARAMLLVSLDGSELYISTDNIHFSKIRTPLLPKLGNEWKRPASTALRAYPSLIPHHDFFFLAYTYIPPNHGFQMRYLMLHEVKLQMP